MERKERKNLTTKSRGIFPWPTINFVKKNVDCCQVESQGSGKLKWGETIHGRVGNTNE